MTSQNDPKDVNNNTDVKDVNKDNIMSDSDLNQLTEIAHLSQSYDEIAKYLKTEPEYTHYKFENKKSSWFSSVPDSLFEEEINERAEKDS